MAMTDEQLIEAALEAKSENERSSMTSLLINRYMRIITIKAAKMKSRRAYIKNSADTEDLMSEGFLGLLSAIRSYSPDKGTFKAFANVCIGNRMLNAVKKLSSGILVADDYDMAEIEDASAMIEEQVIEKEQESAITDKLAGLLSKKENEVLTLYLNGYSYKSIAKKTETSVKAVDNALSRVRGKLKAYYKQI